MSVFQSPFKPKNYPALPPMEGVRMATAQAGIVYQGRTDVLLMVFDENTKAAGVFTRSQCPSAAVDWCCQKLKIGKEKRALLVNSGNANAFTGLKGKESVERSVMSVCEVFGFHQDEIMLASTGVIGAPLDPLKFDAVMDDLHQDIIGEEAEIGECWAEAARAIMTTDTFPKYVSRQVQIDGVIVTLNGIAKGAGMIAPDMATMLSFIATDACLHEDVLQNLLDDFTPKTFNAISIDGDTSTSDSVMLFATQKADHKLICDPKDGRLDAFKEALYDLMLALAHLIVKDGEGLTKFITIKVSGAKSDVSAKKIAQSIANSPLVKTAFAGEDANWGRVVMAVGKAGEPADRDRLSIWFDDLQVAKEGMRDPDYSEETASQIMKQDEITLTVDLGIGEGSFTFWTCDLTHDYISINADYRS